MNFLSQNSQQSSLLLLLLAVPTPLLAAERLAVNVVEELLLLFPGVIGDNASGGELLLAVEAAETCLDAVYVLLLLLSIATTDLIAT